MTRSNKVTNARRFTASFACITLALALVPLGGALGVDDLVVPEGTTLLASNLLVVGNLQVDGTLNTNQGRAFCYPGSGVSC